MSKEEIIGAILELQQKYDKLEKILTDLGYDSNDGEFNGIVYDQSTEEVVNYLNSAKEGNK